MKKLLLLLFIVMLFQPLSSAQIPFGVSTTKVVIDGTIDISDSGSWCNLNGVPSHSETTYDGLWDFIEMDSMEYTLTFWNVGQEGERVGMLFGRKNIKKQHLP